MASQLIPPSSDTSSPASISAAHTALLLCDYQSLIVSMLGKTGSAAVQQAVLLRNWAASHGIAVLHCTIDLATPAPPTSRIAARQKDYQAMIASKPGSADECPELSGFTEDLRVQRQLGKVSALYSHGIREFLKDRGTRSLIIAGLSTSGVALSTARAATDEGFVVTVARDACGDRTEETHRVVMDNAMMGAYVLSTEEIIREYEQGWV